MSTCANVHKALCIGCAYSACTSLRPCTDTRRCVQHDMACTRYSLLHPPHAHTPQAAFTYELQVIPHIRPCLACQRCEHAPGSRRQQHTAFGLRVHGAGGTHGARQSYVAPHVPCMRVRDIPQTYMCIKVHQTLPLYAHICIGARCLSSSMHHIPPPTACLCQPPEVWWQHEAAWQQQ